MKTTCSTCPYCGVGCGVRADTQDKSIRITGDTTHPANQGKLCVKGSHLHETLGQSERLVQPKVGGQPVDWSTALDAVAQGFNEVHSTHGPGAIAMYLSGQLLTEDYYVANKLMKGFWGSANVDTNSRLCMASAVAAHKRAFGEDIVPCNYSDLESCSLLVMTGWNAAWTHPVLYQRIEQAKAQTGMKVVVIDPQTTPTCAIADVHLKTANNSDLWLFNGLFRWLSENHANTSFIAEHTSGLSDTFPNLPTLEATAHATRLPIEQIEAFFQLFAQHDKTVTAFSQGVNQSQRGTDTGNAIINCHLVTGRIGQPGCGPFSITGQPNAMGGREVGGMANQLAAHLDFVPEHIQAVADFWQAPHMAKKPGLKAVDMFEAVHRGEIKALWIMGTNPVVSLPDTQLVEEALARCPLVVVSDCIEHTSTTQYADILLPAAAWGEKDGMVTNSERCVSRQRGFLPHAGEARADWDIISAVGRLAGFASAFDYSHPQAVFTEYAALTGVAANFGRMLDLSEMATLSRQEYNSFEPTQWPVERPFKNLHFSTPDGRARFVFQADAPANTAIPVSPQAGTAPEFILNTGRSRDQWHTMTRTGLAPTLAQHQQGPTVRLNAQDHPGINSGDLVEIYNNGGRVRMIADVSPDHRSGNLFVPIHWNSQNASHAQINALVAPVCDPHSGQPASKHSLARVRKIQPQWWIRCVSTQPGALADVRDTHTYWASFPNRAGGHCIEIATDEFSRFTNLPTSAVMKLHDGTWRAWSVEGNTLIYAAQKRSDLPGFEQLETMLSGKNPAWQRLSVLGSSVSSAPVICSCFEVRLDEIVDAIGQGFDTQEQLTASLKCGSNCGSCKPELSKLVQEYTPTVQKVISQ